jgi:hypothetical protein
MVSATPAPKVGRVELRVAAPWWRPYALSCACSSLAGRTEPAHLDENRKRASKQAAPLDLLDWRHGVRAVRVGCGLIPVRGAVGRRRDAHQMQREGCGRHRRRSAIFGTSILGIRWLSRDGCHPLAAAAGRERARA